MKNKNITWKKEKRVSFIINGVKRLVTRLFCLQTPVASVLVASRRGKKLFWEAWTGGREREE